MKNVTVSCRIEENIKNDAEAILQQLGIPVSVAISALYRQIKLHPQQIRQSLPLTLPRRDELELDLSDPELNARLERGYQQVMSREGRPLDEVFDDLERKYSI